MARRTKTAVETIFVGRERAYNRRFLQMCGHYLVDPVEAACSEALGEGVHSADVILNILARAREPARTMTIMTPDALRLRHEPAADCARYDDLRRTL